MSTRNLSLSALAGVLALGAASAANALTLNCTSAANAEAQQIFGEGRFIRSAGVREMRVEALAVCSPNDLAACAIKLRQCIELDGEQICNLHANYRFQIRNAADGNPDDVDQTVTVSEGELAEEIPGVSLAAVGFRLRLPDAGAYRQTRVGDRVSVQRKRTLALDGTNDGFKNLLNCVWDP